MYSYRQRHKQQQTQSAAPSRGLASPVSPVQTPGRRRRQQQRRSRGPRSSRGRRGHRRPRPGGTGPPAPPPTRSACCSSGSSGAGSEGTAPPCPPPPHPPTPLGETQENRRAAPAAGLAQPTTPHTRCLAFCRRRRAESGSDRRRPSKSSVGRGRGAPGGVTGPHRRSWAARASASGSGGGRSAAELLRSGAAAMTPGRCRRGRGGLGAGSERALGLAEYR